MQKMWIFFIICVRIGFINKFYQKVVVVFSGKFEMVCFVEGFYGVKYFFDLYGSFVFFVGGVGIIYQVLYVWDFVVGFVEGIVVICKIFLVWIIQSFEYLEWICFWMIEIFGMDWW